MSYIIENITNKQVNTKFGPKPAYSVKTAEGWFSYGFKKPTFNIGDEVDFQYTENTYGKNIDHASVRMINKAPAGAAPAPAAAPAARPAYAQKVFPIPLLHGDRAIVRQNSVTNATKLVVESSGKGKTPEELAEQIINVARMFEAYSCGDLEALEAEKMSEDASQD